MRFLRPKLRHGLIALALACTLLVAVRLGDGHSDRAAAQASSTAPNVLLIIADDQTDRSFTPRYMPQVFRWIVDPGVRFPDGLAAPPLCCPDRAGIFTGEYPHNHGVFSTAPGYGALIDPANTLPTWLQQAGYRTGLVGKFLNRYDRMRGLDVGFGFDSWFETREPVSYYNYSVNADGTLRHFGDAPRDYTTRVMTRHAESFIDDQSPSSDPFFLTLAYHAPHTDPHSSVSGCTFNDPVPPSAHSLGPFLHTPLPRPASFNERNVSDKPPAIANLPPLRRKTKKAIAGQWRCTLAAVRSLDHGVGSVMRNLKDQGLLANTLVFYVSDNGFMFGEHRLRGKSVPYEPSLRVPYAVRAPASSTDNPPDASPATLVTNQDIAPTILDFAGDLPSCDGTSDCRRIDGMSLRPLLGGGGKWRKRDGVLVEINSREAAYTAIRTARYMYVQDHGGARELYDLRRDPQELRNEAGSASSRRVERHLATRLKHLARCSGVRGVDAKLDGHPFCS